MPGAVHILLLFAVKEIFLKFILFVSECSTLLSTSGYTPDDLSTAVDNVVDICRHDRLRNSVLGAGLKLAYAKKA